MLIERSWQRAAKADFSLASTEPSSLSRASAEVWPALNSCCHANDSIGAKHQRQSMLMHKRGLSAPLSSAADARPPPHRRRPRPATRSRRAQSLAARGAGGGGRSPTAARPVARPLVRCRHRGRWLYGDVDRPPSEGARTGAGGRAAGAGHLRRRPSGRNGGFVNAWWDELDTLEELYGAGAGAIRRAGPVGVGAGDRDVVRAARR